MSPPVSFDEYVGAVAIIRGIEGEWREGQTYFNVLHRLRPDLAETVRGTLIDPFHSDAIVPEFLEHVARRWEEGDGSPE